ncbi:MAG: hypothetical protein ABIQ11_11765 [Saprospiraceae bacterium]
MTTLAKTSSTTLTNGFYPSTDKNIRVYKKTERPDLYTDHREGFTRQNLSARIPMVYMLQPDYYTVFRFSSPSASEKTHSPLKSIVMKTHSIICKIKSVNRFLLLSLCLILFSTYTAHGQIKTSRTHDYFMPAKGKSMIEVYTGIPYVAIAQYSYSFSDRFSVGILYGYTPDVLGYGLRVKAVIAEPSSSFRINLKSPFIYYPRMSAENAESWVLAWPTINGELKLKNEARIWAGFGVIGAACVDYFGSKIEKEDRHPPGHDDGDEEHEEIKEAELWNTLQIGYSKPLSNKLSYVIEIAPVMKGLKFTTPRGLLNGIPVIVTFGMTYSL